MRRAKVAISIRPDVLAAVERLIDGSKIRNRSQAIEDLIMKSVKVPFVTQAVMYEYGITRHREIEPIPLQKIGKMTIFERNLTFLKKHGISTVFMMADRGNPSRYLELGKRIGVNVVVYKAVGSTAGRLLALRDELEENFLVINGDCIAEFNLQSMIRVHISSNNCCTLSLKETANGKNLIKVEGTRITYYGYLPTGRSSFITSAGFDLFNKRVFEYIKKNSDSQEHELLPLLAKKKQLGGYTFSGDWWHFQDKKTLEEYKHLNS